MLTAPELIKNSTKSKVNFGKHTHTRIRYINTFLKQAVSVNRPTNMSPAVNSMSREPSDRMTGYNEREKGTWKWRENKQHVHLKQ